MESLPDITALFTAQFQIGILVLVRVTSMLLLLPVLGSMSLPFQVRVALGLAFTIVIVPGIPNTSVVLPKGAPDFFLLVFREIVVGLLVGWVFSLIFQVVEIAGALIDMQAGYSMVELFDPITGQTSHLFGQFLVAVSTVSFMVSGAMGRMVVTLVDSFVAVPLDSAALRAEALLPQLQSMAITAFSTGLQLAGPVLMAILMVTVVMAVVSRVMPAMNAWMLAMPLQIVAACAVTAAGLPWMMHVFGIWENQVFQGVDRLLRTMG